MAAAIIAALSRIPLSLIVRLAGFVITGVATYTLVSAILASQPQITATAQNILPMLFMFLSVFTVIEIMRLIRGLTESVRG